MRQIVLDTETTGLNWEEGHRVIEIGCVELIDRKVTGNHYHQYFNPEREIDAAALSVHGIKKEFLETQPLFKTEVNKLIEFIEGAELIIHNAPFDVAFLNYEFTLIGDQWKKINDYCRILDTLKLARQLHAGQRNNLDALCKRYSVDNTKRDFHGALLDAHLLTNVYLAMTGGQGNFFDTFDENEVINNSKTFSICPNKNNLTILKASEEELQAHQEYLILLKKQGKCLWND